MPVESTPSTFEYTRDWLVSSPLLVEALLAGGPEYGTEEERIAAARERIDRDEIWVEPDTDNVGEDSPDVPSPVRTIPRALVKMTSTSSRKVGTMTWADTGEITIAIWALVPEEFRVNHRTDDALEKSNKFRGRREWGDRLATQIVDQLRRTAGGHDGDNPYLDAKNVRRGDNPIDLDDDESAEGVGFEIDLEW